MIGEPGWLGFLPPRRPLDAAVSTTALHYLGEDTLRRVYRELAARLRPGGVLINGDHRCPDEAKVSEIVLDIGRRRAERQLAFTHDDWESWWSGVAADPDLAAVLAARRSHRHPPCEGNDLTPSGHTALLCEAGFESIGTVRQFGHSHVLVAVR